MIPHLVISGAPSTGKSSLIRELRLRYPQLEDRCYFIQDGGRWWLEKHAEECGAIVSVDRLTPQERRRMQLEMFDYYMEGEREAIASGRILVADAFVAEMLVYSRDCLDEETLAKLETRLADYRYNMRALVLPGAQLELELDGVRHCDPSFRAYVEDETIAMYHKHHIPYTVIHTNDLEERVNIVAGMLGVNTMARVV